MTSPVIVGSILIGADDLVSEMVRSRIPQMRDRSFGECTALGVVRRGVLVGGWVYHRYRGFDVMISAAFDRPGWALPGTVRALFEYPFHQLGCERISAWTGKKNRKARKALEDLGFVLEGVCKRGYDGVEDACMYGLLKQDCRWLKGREDVQRYPASTAAA